MASAVEAAPEATPAPAYVTVAEREARGKAARAEVPRSSHGEFRPPARRADPIKLLDSQAKARAPGQRLPSEGRVSESGRAGGGRPDGDELLGRDAQPRRLVCERGYRLAAG